MIGDIANPEDIWRLHDFLRDKQKEIDEKYDYRATEPVAEAHWEALDDCAKKRLTFAEGGL